MLAELLAVLSASAAGGLRLALPLLMIGLLYGDRLWSKTPLLSRCSPYLVVVILASWTVCEFFLIRSLLGQRILQGVKLVFSPLVGALMGITAAKITGIGIPIWGIGILGGVLALVLQLVQTGWFYRLRGLPWWLLLLQDLLCVILVLFAIKAPQQGGLIALLLLWLALRSSKDWYRFYRRPSTHRQT
jgi:Domain of unknown function (DUF4126)